MNWAGLGIFLACRAHKPRDAEAAFRNAIRLQPNDADVTRNLGKVPDRDLGDLKGGSEHLERAHQLRPNDPITAAIAAAAKRGAENSARCEFPSMLLAASTSGG